MNIEKEAITDKAIITSIKKLNKAEKEKVLALISVIIFQKSLKSVNQLENIHI